MATRGYLQITLALTVLIYSACGHPIVSSTDGGGDERLLISSDPVNTGTASCATLKDNIGTCLLSFEQKLIVYRADDTSKAQQRILAVQFCHEYERSLQCLHMLFQMCPPSQAHLDLVEHRLGYLHDYMVQECYTQPQDMTPVPTSTVAPSSDISTTQPPSTTWSLHSTVTEKKHNNEGSSTPQTSTSPTRTTTRPTRRTTTFNIGLFSTKLNKINKKMSLPTTNVYDTVELSEQDKIMIPMDIAHNSLDIGVVSSQVDCETPGGGGGRRCALLLSNSATNFNTRSLIFTSIFTLSVTLMHFL